jgi:hypothetical protein
MAPARHRSRPSNTPVDSPVASLAGAIGARRQGRQATARAAPPRAGRRRTASFVTRAPPECRASADALGGCAVSVRAGR